MDRIIEKKLWTPKRIIWMALGVIIIALVLYSLIFGDRSSRLNVQRERLTIEQVVRDSFHDYISITGTVIPISTVYLDAMEGGRVEEILQEEGNLVDKGDIILQLSNTNLHLEIMNREASLAEQMNNLRNTRLLMEQNKLDLKQQILELEYRVRMQEKEYLNKQSLYEKKYISEDEYSDARESYEYLFNRMELVIESQKQDSLFRNIQIQQLEESVNRMQDNLNLVRKRLENLDVRAPVAGELAFINAEIGESKSAGERLGQINILDSYKIRAEIDEYYISRIVRGLPGDFEFSGQTYQLEVTKVYTVVSGGRFTVEMEFVDALPER
ncbi:MAG: HlyD family efflux transporter periplasmic adaptor subunit, partial [Candidatus Cloacimonetes bacterium]|nr:HlyD family efflux transporter periplasmic adaptor subunit [Candidatus Cloacimonadota bacterium]